MVITTFCITTHSFLKVILYSIYTLYSVPTAPTEVSAIQKAPTSILVSWGVSSDSTGYRIDYNSSGGDQGSETISGGSTDIHTLTGLQNGDTYTISVSTTSPQFSSESVTVPHSIGLGEVCLHFTTSDPL